LIPAIEPLLPSAAALAARIAAYDDEVETRANALAPARLLGSGRPRR